MCEDREAKVKFMMFAEICHLFQIEEKKKNEKEDEKKKKTKMDLDLEHAPTPTTNDLTEKNMLDRHFELDASSPLFPADDWGFAETYVQNVGVEEVIDSLVNAA